MECLIALFVLTLAAACLAAYWLFVPPSWWPWAADRARKSGN